MPARRFPPPLKTAATPGTPPATSALGAFGEPGFFIRTTRTPDEWADWCIAKNQIAEVLKEYYRTCTIEELPPQLLTLLKKLDDELLKRQEQ
jgi:hypothetical protein